ncbi:hypothetical protein G6F56_013651 [Rhizopus delemar]|nr:hypothetical protein G6F56_013651 [Rhizopus delemar]
MTEQNISQTNSYLKNLSQKKYAWMEEAAASLPKPAVDVKREPRKTKKKKRPSSPQPQPQLPQQLTTPTITTVEPEPKKMKKTTKMKTEEMVEKKKKQPRFKYTNFPVKGYHILPTRNITSNFSKADTSFIQGNKAGSEDILPQFLNGFKKT